MNLSGKTVVFLCALLLLSSVACNLLAPRGRPTTQPQAQPANPQPAPDNPDLPDDLANPDDNGDFTLEGTWVSETDTQLGVMDTELILEYTGTFSQQVTLGDLLTYDVGTYAVGDGFIRFIVEKHEPKTYKGQEMHWLTSFTYYYTVVDADTMVFEDRIAGTRWTVHRK